MLKIKKKLKEETLKNFIVKYNKYFFYPVITVLIMLGITKDVSNLRSVHGNN